MSPDPPGFGAEPTFTEPWQAKAFAITVTLSRSGLFTWPEWAAMLGAEIALHPQRPGEEGEAAYYRQWLAALEKLLAARNIATTSDIAEMAEHWRRSYLHTPHGRPVDLHREPA